MEEGKLKIRVTVPPEGGKANKAVIELLSKALKVPKSSIEIVRGDTSRNKVIFISGVSPSFIKEKLQLEVEEIS